MLVSNLFEESTPEDLWVKGNDEKTMVVTSLSHESLSIMAVNGN